MILHEVAHTDAAHPAVSEKLLQRAIRVEREIETALTLPPLPDGGELGEFSATTTDQPQAMLRSHVGQNGVRAADSGHALTNGAPAPSSALFRGSSAP